MNRSTPLHKASQERQLEVTRSLIVHGANVPYDRIDPYAGRITCRTVPVSGLFIKIRLWYGTARSRMPTVKCTAVAVYGTVGIPRGAWACRVTVELRTGGISQHMLMLSSWCLARNWEGRRQGADRFDDRRTSGGWVGCKPHVNSMLQATAAAVIRDRLPSGRWMRPSLTMVWPALTQRMRMCILQPGSPGPPDSGTLGAWSAAAQVQVGAETWKGPAEWILKIVNLWTSVRGIYQL